MANTVIDRAVSEASPGGAGAAPKRRIALIFNPAAGRRRRRTLGRVVKALEAREIDVSVAATSGPGDATRLARRAVSDGVDVVAAAGGDGTIREVVTGMIGSGALLGIVPMGTASVLAAELRLPRRPEAVAAVLAGGIARALHVPRANGRPFLLMAGAGFDGTLVESVSPGLTRRSTSRSGRTARIGRPSCRLARYESNVVQGCALPRVRPRGRVHSRTASAQSLPCGKVPVRPDRAALMIGKRWWGLVLDYNDLVHHTEGGSVQRSFPDRTNETELPDSGPESPGRSRSGRSCSFFVGVSDQDATVQGIPRCSERQRSLTSEHLGSIFRGQPRCKLFTIAAIGHRTSTRPVACRGWSARFRPLDLWLVLNVLIHTISNTRRSMLATPGYESPLHTLIRLRMMLILPTRFGRFLVTSRSSRVPVAGVGSRTFTQSVRLGAALFLIVVFQFFPNPLSPLSISSARATTHPSTTASLPAVPAEERPASVDIERNLAAYEKLILTAFVTALGTFILILVYKQMKNMPETQPQDILRVYVIVLIVIGVLLLISMGLTYQQISPAIAIFGTIAGYLLGRSDRRVPGKPDSENNGND